MREEEFHFKNLITANFQFEGIGFFITFGL